jgi:hypothetical protein
MEIMGEMRDLYKNSVCKREMKKPLERQGVGRRNIKTNLTELGLEVWNGSIWQRTGTSDVFF